MNDNGNAAAAMLGLDGFVLVEVSQQHGGLEQAVEISATEAFCATCGA